MFYTERVPCAAGPPSRARNASTFSIRQRLAALERRKLWPVTVTAVLFARTKRATGMNNNNNNLLQMCHESPTAHIALDDICSTMTRRLCKHTHTHTSNSHARPLQAARTRAKSICDMNRVPTTTTPPCVRGSHLVSSRLWKSALLPIRYARGACDFFVSTYAQSGERGSHRARPHNT